MKKFIYNTLEPEFKLLLNIFLLKFYILFLINFIAFIINIIFYNNLLYFIKLLNKYIIKKIKLIKM